MTMPKIVDRVERAYRETGYKPSQTTGLAFPSRGAATAIGVLAVAEGVVRKKDDRFTRDDRVYQWATQEFGFEYFGDFVRGFAYYSPGDDIQPPGAGTGFRHGQLTAQRVLRDV